MPENLRALVVVMGLALPVFWLAKGPLCRTIFSPQAYRRLRNLWLAVTLATFLAPGFWIYILLVGAIALFWGQHLENPLAAYVLVLFAAPPYLLEIPGLGLLQHLFAIDHYRLLGLTILLPMALRLWGEKRGSGSRLADGLVIAVLSWMLLIRLVNDSPTGTLRGLFYLLLDNGLPYFVASRALTTTRQFQQVAAALSLSAVIVALVATFEAQRYWLLYSALGSAWDIMGQMPMYLARGVAPDSVLRARVSLGHPIALGYALALGLMMTCAIHAALQPSWKRSIAYAALASGLVASMSRGPWVGAAAGLIAFIAVGPGAGRRILTLVLTGGIGLPALMLSPYAERVIAYLPFVGTVETGNIDYRSRLIDVSMTLLARDPLTGNFDFKSDPLMEEMRQGEGIIDVVNTYLQIALPFGLVGLALFLGVFAAAFRAAWTTRRATSDLEIERLGRGFCACLIAVLVTISTVSSIFGIPTLYWLLAGLCAGYAAAFGESRRRAWLAEPAPARVRPA